MGEAMDMADGLETLETGWDAIRKPDETGNITTPGMAMGKHEKRRGA
jgi:hypothetical protein